MDRLKALLKLVGWFAWFTLALLLVTASAGAAVGAFTGNWVNGIIVMFGGAMLLVFGEIGRTMIRTMRVLITDLQRAFIKASDSIEEQTQEKK
jgi:hypothetical protein